jgi:hypothetical protein
MLRQLVWRLKALQDASSLPREFLNASENGEFGSGFSLEQRTR